MTGSIDAAQLRAEMESDLAWREAELRFFENQMQGQGETQVARYRRALVLMIYAHMEGFCKVAFSAYVSAINRASYANRDVTWTIAALSMARVFARLRSNDIKSKVFKNILPDDSKLHRYCRDAEFLESLQEFETAGVSLDPNEVVDLESNLRVAVLKKILYRLGLDTAMADQWADDINLLLHRRNGVAHGSDRQLIQDSDFKRMRLAASSVCNGLMQALFSAARQNAHVRP